MVGQPLPVPAPHVVSRSIASEAPSRMALLASFALYQLGWFAAVLLAAHSRPWLAAAALVPFLALHLAYCARPARELRLLALAALIGLAWDSAVMATGWQHYAGGQVLAALAPLWVVVLWAQFATLLRGPLRWLRGRPLLAALLGLVGGPLAWAGGARLGAVQLVPPMPALLLQAAGWAALTPCLIWLGARHDA